MIELTEKYVFHIPLYKCMDGELVLIELDDLLDELFDEFTKNGFKSWYVTKVESFYKSVTYDEVLITIFTSKDESPCKIFEDWFRRNNDILCQKYFAYECGNGMIICDLISN